MQSRCGKWDRCSDVFLGTLFVEAGDLKASTVVRKTNCLLMKVVPYRAAGETDARR
jgi:hypothetical protein